MPELVAWADVAVSTGGSTGWELCMMGLPTIVFIIADNQTQAVNWLVKNKIVYSSGITKELSVVDITSMVTKLCQDYDLIFAQREGNSTLWCKGKAFLLPNLIEFEPKSAISVKLH